jgi:uncharacterized protein (DUF111 family)
VKTAYFDLISGASGDMILGALVDAGLPFAELRDALNLLGLPEFKLTETRVMRGAFAATKIDVHTADAVHARGLNEIEQIISASRLPAHIQERALRVFQRLAEAEADIHGVPVETIHFHELGAVDTIVDVTGALLALEGLGADRVVSSPVPLGRGMARSAHGAMPLPAPATVALLRGAKVVGVDHAKDPKGQGTLYLLLNPLEAQYAALAVGQGELFVTHRKEGDLDMYPMEMSDYRKFFR